MGSRYVSGPVANRSLRTLPILGLFACLVGAAAAPDATARAEATAAPHMTAAPHATPAARAARVGPAPAGQRLQLVLPLRVDAAGLARFATAVSTPGSPMYGRYLSIPALARRFGASASARARVVGFLRASGATDVKVDATGLLAEAKMSARLAQRVFASPLAEFRAADHARFLAPVTAIRVPAAIHELVTGVVGLDTEPESSSATPSFATALGPLRLGPLRSTAHAAAQSSSALPRSGAPAGCPAGIAAGAQDGNPGFTPNQYLSAYDFDPLHIAGYTGQGERVALVEIDGYSAADVAAFAQCFGFAVPPVKIFGVGLSQPLAPVGETTLDVEVLDAAAPGLKAIDVYQTNSDAAATLGAFAAPLQDAARRPQVISASLGLCEPQAYDASGLIGIEATERVLEVAASDGISVLAASGDNGSADCETAGGDPIDQLAVNYPASSQWATAVGGTNLALNATNQIVSQSVWNDGSVADAAGGGGVSALFTRPSYQKGVVRRNRREVPDVSMLADLLPGYSIYCSASPECVNDLNTSPWLAVGGTSAATPLLAGGVAIVDQMLRMSHRENLGLLNPLIYKLGRSTAGPAVFGDIASGSIDLGPYIPGGDGLPLGCCTATAGYDDATGWGSVSIGAFATQALTMVPNMIKFSLALPRHQRPLARHELIADVTCSAACSIGAFAVVTIGKKTSFTTTSKAYGQRSKGRKAIPVKFSKAQQRTLRSAAAHHRKIVATVYGVLIDTLGEIQNHTRGQKLAISP